MDTARAHANRLAALLRNERNALVEVVLELVRFDDRRGWEELGYASLWDFLKRDLRLSDGTAYSRMKAAELSRQFPEFVDALRDGRLCVSVTGEVAKVLTRENLAAVLPRYFNVSTRDAKAITVGIQPKAVVPTRTVVTAVRAHALASSGTASPEGDASTDRGAALQAPETAGCPASQPVLVAPPAAPVVAPPRRARGRPARRGPRPPRRHRPPPRPREARRQG